ncbi:MAG: hypothetical protein COA36_03500 [Desulfotalea sp.]|nr:MAG: hypothetical protein COA36_03500 [Desulfotalea sp.]
MIFYLHIAHSLDRQLQKNSTSLTKSDLAVLKCRQLLCDIREYGLRHEQVLNKRTRKGEKRLKNCVKYDMGAGWRLVTVMNNNHLFLTFLGSHDGTDQWFSRHKGEDFLPENHNYSCRRIRITDRIGRVVVLGGGELSEADVYEAELEAKLDEVTLLSIFRGLS